MLGEPLTPDDIEAVDPDYSKNLKWMLENDITNVLDLNFTAGARRHTLASSTSTSTSR